MYSQQLHTSALSQTNIWTTAEPVPIAGLAFSASIDPGAERSTFRFFEGTFLWLIRLQTKGESDFFVVPFRRVRCQIWVKKAEKYSKLINRSQNPPDRRTVCRVADMIF